MFEHYLNGGPDTHQQVPSRFHPVPTRNVFQSPSAGFELDRVMESEGNPLLRGQPPQRPAVEELPLPQSQPDNYGTPNSDQPTQSPTPASPPLELDPQAAANLLHRQLIQYPYATDSQQQVADWVRGNYVTGTKESLRLHSALRTPENDSRYR